MNQSVINNLAAKINSKEQKSNKVTNWNNTPSDDKYPSEKLVKDSLDGKANSTHNQASSTITDSHTYTNIGNVANTQESINSAIDTKLGQLSNIDAINVVSTLPTASSSTIGKLYIISEYGVINVYYTEEDNGSYSWHEMDADILDEFSIDWIDIVNNPFSSALPEDYATSSHSHGGITSDGKIGSSSGYLLITSTGGTIISAQTISSSKIKDSNAHSNIGSSANDTQSTINSAIDTALGSKVNTSDLGAVALSNSYNDLTNKPNIPSASNTTPSADTTNGSVGTGTTWAKSDHTHPKSSIYAESTHTHSPSDINSNIGVGIIDEYDDLNSEFDSNFDSSGGGAVLFDSLIYSTHEDNLFVYDGSRTWSKVATLNDIPSPSTTLGNAYYQYILTASGYNVSVSNNVTIYCTVTNVFGNAVTNKTVTLYQNGTSVGNATTDSNGVASWTVAMNTVGNYVFSVENSNITVKVRGVKTISTATYGTMYINESEKTVFFKYYRTNYNFTSTSYITLHTGACGDYKPITETYLASYNPTMAMSVTATGDIKVISTGTGTKNMAFSGYWHY